MKVAFVSGFVFFICRVIVESLGEEPLSLLISAKFKGIMHRISVAELWLPAE